MNGKKRKQFEMSNNFLIHACQIIESLHPTQQKCSLKCNMIVHIQQGMECVSKVSVVNKTDPRFSVTIDVSGSWCCGIFFNTQSLSLPWHSCINIEYVCFSQMLVLSTLQYKSLQCTYSIRTTFMSICNVLALEGLCHTTKLRISIR